MRPAYTLEYDAKQTYIELPERYSQYGLVNKSFECWIDNDIVSDIAKLIRAGWTPINSCSGTKANHKKPKGIFPYLTIWLANAEEDKFTSGLSMSGIEMHPAGGRAITFIINSSYGDASILERFHALTEQLLKYAGPRHAQATQCEVSCSGRC